MTDENKKRSVWVLPLSEFQISVLRHLFKHDYQYGTDIIMQVQGISFTDKMDLIIDFFQRGELKQAIVAHSDDAESFLSSNRSLKWKLKQPV